MPDPATSPPRLIDGFHADPDSDLALDVQKALHIARILQRRASELQTAQERRQQAELDRMIHNPRDKATLVQLTDQAFRAATPHRAADQLTHILDVQGVPRFFSPVDRALLKGFQSFGDYLPGVAVPLVKEKMHKETANVVLPAEREHLVKHLDSRRREGVRMNVNYLGEALLGESEAERRLEQYLEALQVPQVEVISVKISTIYSQISPLARGHTISVLCDRLELLFRAAMRNRFERGDGAAVPKFVYLDMEEYRDMHLTAEAFMRTLDRKGLERASAGIALQAYVPDSFAVQKQINAWARRRVEAGGAPVTIRIVKGANMESERVEASIAGWPQAPFKIKAQTDANYKRMLREGMRPDNLTAVRLGVASHNLFDLAYGLVLAAENQAGDRVQFEMLEGMANHQRRALFEMASNLLLYAPACKYEDFIYAIGYLIRRLDENTGSDNFLRHAFKLEVDSDEWKRLEQQFVDSFKLIDELAESPRRMQDRNVPPPLEAPRAVGETWRGFRNEPDTDWSLPHNGDWGCGIIERWQPRRGDNAADIPLVIAGEELRNDRSTGECIDPSRPGVIVGRYRIAGVDDIERAVACAKADDDGWRAMPVVERRALLRSAAHEVRKARGDLMGAAMAEGGKLLTESDPEVSEAVDFIEFYSATAESFIAMDSVKATPRGVVAVVPPWNFPIAIPCGGVAAALAAGNTVILKPALETVLVAWELCQCFWRAGISRKALQFAPCLDEEGATRLVTHDAVDAVVFTGGTDTALHLLRLKPAMRLLAETGGKNAMIVTAMSDRDLAVKQVLHSAFSHSGQKCSAASLLLLEEEVYDDPKFKQTLRDAVESLAVGPAWDIKNRMGPLIRPPGEKLERGLKELEPGESWAVMPHELNDNPHLWSPGVKWGVTPGSFTHLNELFGPVLGVMKFRRLEEAVAIVNQTGYGLTSGLQSLDDREQEVWIEGVRAGNLYVNRTTVGAVVLRQPFGGFGKSAIGPGVKAGGPNYVAQLMRFEDAAEPRQSENITDDHLVELVHDLMKLVESEEAPGNDIQRVISAIGSYDYQVKQEFGREHDHFRLIGQDNIRRYLPVGAVRVRVHRDDSFFEVLARVCAAKAAKCRITVSSPTDDDHAAVAMLERLTESWAAAIEFVEESDDALAEVIREGRTDRMRYASPTRVPDVVRRAAAEVGFYIADAPVLAEGRIELLWHTREQSICVDYHRYGNLGARADEERAETL